MKRLVVFVLLVVLVAATNVIVQRSNVIVRKGPGIFFPKIGELQKNQTVEIYNNLDNWVEINFDNQVGYIAKKGLESQESNDDIFKKMGTQKTDLIISKHGLSAGVKGFAARTNRDMNSARNFVEIYRNYQYDLNQCRKIARSMNSKSVNIPNKFHHRYFSDSELRFGLAIAKKIAGIGLLQNQKKQDYINSVGAYLVSRTELYDQEFKFFILDTDKVNAYAVPGGIIFITSGMIDTLENEAELAVILSHEIAHCIRRHGLEEAEERKELITAENSFAELDNELDDLGIEQDEEILKVEEELENDLMDFYDRVFDGRLMEYEYEADFYATVYAARAGYNPEVIYNILDRLIAQNTQSTNEHYTKNQLLTRKNNINQKGIVRMTNYPLATQKARFDKECGNQ